MQSQSQSQSKSLVFEEMAAVAAAAAAAVVSVVFVPIPAMHPDRLGCDKIATAIGVLGYHSFAYIVVYRRHRLVAFGACRLPPANGLPVA